MTQNTIWTFREALTNAGAIEDLFRRFDQALKISGYLAMGGQKSQNAQKAGI